MAISQFANECRTLRSFNSSGTYIRIIDIRNILATNPQIKHLEYTDHPEDNHEYSWLSDETVNFSLRSLNLSGCHVTSEALRNILKKHTDLETLKIGNLERLTSADLRYIAENCPKLKHLDITDCSQFFSIDLKYLASMLKLESINLTRCAHFSSLDLRAIIDTSPSLKTINITECPQVSAEDLKHIASKVTNLNITGCYQFTLRVIKYIVENSPKLQTFNITDCPHVSKQDLENFKVTNCQIIYRSSYDFSNAPFVVNSKSFRNTIINNGEKLREIILGNCLLEDKDLEFAFRECPRLRIKLSGSRYLFTETALNSLKSRGFQIIDNPMRSRNTRCKLLVREAVKKVRNNKDAILIGIAGAYFGGGLAAGIAVTCGYIWLKQAITRNLQIG